MSKAPYFETTVRDGFEIREAFDGVEYTFSLWWRGHYVESGQSRSRAEFVRKVEEAIAQAQRRVA